MLTLNILYYTHGYESALSGYDWLRNR